MKLITLLVCLITSMSILGQKQLRGKVTDKETGQPLSGASVFLSNTSIGTTSNVQGVFTLSISEGKFELIVSSIGYETHSQTISAASLSDHLSIALKPKAKELETVTVQAFEKDGWQKWGSFFLQNFIGTSALAQNCILKNKEAIRFRHSKATNEIFAVAHEPLIIENKALGYRIRYNLEEFNYDFNTRYLYYAGYPFFEELQGSAAKKRQWAKARQNIYDGSMLHFMRSIFRNKLLEEGFEVYALQKIPNTEKMRVKERYRLNHGTKTQGRLPNDSTEYYNRILAQSDYIDVVGKNKLIGDSVAYAVNSTTAGLDFGNYLLVIYPKGNTPAEYRRQFPENVAMMSQLTLINNRPIEIEANGSYYLPTDLLSLGWWAWSEKMATMLPFDYWPASK